MRMLNLTGAVLRLPIGAGVRLGDGELSDNIILTKQLVNMVVRPLLNVHNIKIKFYLNSAELDVAEGVIPAISIHEVDELKKLQEEYAKKNYPTKEDIPVANEKSKLEDEKVENKKKESKKEEKVTTKVDSKDEESLGEPVEENKVEEPTKDEAKKGDPKNSSKKDEDGPKADPKVNKPKK